MRYTENRHTAEEHGPHLAPRALEDHLNLSQEQLDISFTEKYQAVNYINQELSIQGELQFYPSDYYDPKITIAEPVVTDSKNIARNTSWVLLFSLVAIVLLSIQLNWNANEKSNVYQREYKAPLKEASNFTDYIKHSGARLAITQEEVLKSENSKIKPADKSSSVSRSENELSLYEFLNTNIPSSNLDKTGLLPMNSSSTLASNIIKKSIKKNAKVLKNKKIGLTNNSKKENITDTKLSVTDPNAVIRYETKTYSGNTPTQSSKGSSVSRESVSLMDQFAQLNSKAQVQEKLYFLKFGASWCLPCQIMEETTFQDELLQDIIKENYLYLNVDVDLKGGINLKQKYNVKKLPTIIIFDKYGHQLEKFEGGVTASKLIKSFKKHKEDLPLARL